MATLSLQLYSMRNHGLLAAQLDAVRDAGFEAVETVGSMLAEASPLREQLDARGLRAPSGHVSMQDLRGRMSWVIEKARALGVETLVMPALHPPLRPTDEAGWLKIGVELGEIAKRLADKGLRLAFHNHHWEVEALPNGRLPLDVLLDAGEPGGLLWQADLAWLVRGGDDPIERVGRHADRLASVHIKDLAPAGEAEDEDGWADPGHGTMDWDDLWARTAYAGLMIAEHDKPSDAARFARRAFETMSRLDKAALEAAR